MYQKRSFGPSSNTRFGNSGRSGGRSHFSGSGPRRRAPQGQHLDINSFINKAVIVEEFDHFIPEHAFADFAIDDKLKRNIEKKGYVAPTSIQDRVIPHILHGKDVVGIANTGTGKTAAFLIPLIDKVIKNPDESVLVVVPTRELAIQIEEELRGFAPGTGLFALTCVGGTSITNHLRNLRHRNHFIIGTPGRLKDLIERGALDLSRTSTVVLDEADRMLDMGFINDMKFLMTKMPRDRHTLFFSATMSKEIERLIHEFLRDPVSISVKTQDTSKNVDQDIVRMRRGEDKVAALEALLREQGFDKVLVFGRTKHGVERLGNELRKRGFTSESIHGDKSQSERQRALKRFKENQSQILVATDVAARGLDIVGVSHVINYDLPATYEDYIHRIGRTGRGNATGKALTFVE